MDESNHSPSWDVIAATPGQIVRIPITKDTFLIDPAKFGSLPRLELKDAEKWMASLRSLMKSHNTNIDGLGDIMSDDSHLSESDKRIKRLLADTVAPESRSVIEAMRKLEGEVRHQYDPDQWGAMVTPFEVVPVKLKKLTKEDIMVKLRARLNKGYMPTSTRPEPSFNSKPQYLDGIGFGNLRDYTFRDHPTFPAPHYFDGFGVVSWTKAVRSETMYAYFGTREMDFLVNLETEHTLVRTHVGNDRKWYDWDSEEFKGKELAVHTYDLDECMDVYL